MGSEDNIEAPDAVDLADAGGELVIRVARSGEPAVTYNGEPVYVSSIDIDEHSIERLVTAPRTVRDQ